MDHDEEVAARLIALISSLVFGAVCLIIFAIYWCSCRRRGMQGVVLGLPNSAQPNTVMISPYNATGAPNYVMGPGQNAMGPPFPTMAPVQNYGVTPYPGMASNPQVAINPAMTTRDAPPSYSQAHQQREELAPLHKPAMQY